MRLSPEVQLPASPDVTSLTRQLRVVFRLLVSKVNLMADGRLAAIDNAATSAPTTGTWAQGDFIRNSQPSELGSAGSKYTVNGWVCVSGGTPGTWVAQRCLTGN